MKIHIALVGKETAPVYYGTFELDPELVILICSEQTKKEAERLENLFQSRDFSVRIFIFPPTNIKEIYRHLEKLQQEIPSEASLSLDLVGGTKFWSLAFYRCFHQRKGTEFYLSEQNYRICNLETGDFISFQGNIEIDEHLLLYGNTLERSTNINEYNWEDDEAVEVIQQIRQKDYRGFHYVSAELSPEENDSLKNREGELQCGDFSVKWRRPSHVEAQFSPTKGGLSFEIDSPHACSMFFNSGWFEYKVARLLRDWKHTKEVRLNCVFPLGNSQKTKNEVDIILNAGTKLIFVECKTKVYDSTDIDKFSNVVKNYGGMGSKALFITDVPMGPLQAKKCQESRILSLSLKDTSNRDISKPVIYGKLDQFLNEINV